MNHPVYTEKSLAMMPGRALIGLCEIRSVFHGGSPFHLFVCREHYRVPDGMKEQKTSSTGAFVAGKAGMMMLDIRSMEEMRSNL
jgi:hypothetical protein